MSRDLTTGELIALLAAAPARLAELTAGRPSTQLHTAPASGEWSANDVLAHLRLRRRVGQRHRHDPDSGSTDHPGRQPADVERTHRLP